MKEERIHYIDFLRGIGIIFVVIGHLSIPEPLHNYIYSFHMPLFFFLGGLVYKKRDIMYDIKKRFCSLMIPYFMWGIIYLLYYHLMALLSGSGTQMDGKEFLGLLMGEYSTIPYDKTLWFLPCFFVVTVGFNTIVTLFHRCFKRYDTIALVLTIFLFGLVSLFLQIPYSVWGVRLAFRFSVFYAMGHFINRLGKKELLPSHRTIVMLCVTILCGSGHFILLLAGGNIGVVNSFIIPAMAILSWYGFARILGRFLQFFEIFGKVSLDIMCTEDLSTNIVQNANEHILNNMLPLAVEVVMILGLCLIYAYVIKRGFLIIKDIFFVKKK